MWPTDDDATLLRIIVGPEEHRREGWGQWVDRVDLDHLSDAAYGLLPGLYAAIEPLDIAHPWVARLRGVYRREWTERQRHLPSAASIAESLEREGIEHLAPADQQVARLGGLGPVPRLGVPRIVVDWWSGPRALATLERDGWTIKDPPDPRESARQRLTRSSWSLTNRAGASAELATSFIPCVVDEARESDLWARARTGPDGLPNAHPADLLVAALTDQLDVPGAVCWAPGAIALIDALGPVDLRPVLDRRVARRVLPMLDARLDFLQTEGLGRHTAHLRSQVAQLIDRHPMPSSATAQARERIMGVARVAVRRPRAISEIRRRHGGWPGVVAAMRGQ